jgi:SAM-dependent methyltransferase
MAIRPGEPAPREGAAAFDRLAPVYDALTDAVPRAGREADALREVLGPLGVRSVHVAACGPGHLVRALAARGYEAEGSDAAPAMVERARAGGLAVRLLDLARPPPGIRGDRDAVLCLGNSLPCVGGLGDVRRALRTLLRLARPGGHVLVHSQNLARLGPDEIVTGPVRAARLAGRETILLRHFHPTGRHVNMHVVVLEREEDGWRETVVPVRLARIEPGWLRDALRSAGASGVRLRGTIGGEPFRAAASRDVYALARRESEGPSESRSPGISRPR